MKKLASRAAGALLLLGTLAACGGDDGGAASDEGDGGGGDTGSYCDDLKAAKEQFQGLEDDTDPAQIGEAFATLRTLGSEAPDEIADEWQTLTDAFDNMEQALSDAGLSLEDLADPEAIQQLDPADLQQLEQDLSSLDSQAIDDAMTAITSHAKDDCGVDVDEGDSGSGSS